VVNVGISSGTYLYFVFVYFPLVVSAPAWKISEKQKTFPKLLWEEFFILVFIYV